MADLFLNWGDLGPYGTNLNDGAAVSVDTGGVAVDISFSAQDDYATAFTFNADGYVGAEDPMSGNSYLKLYDDANNDGAPGTSTTVMDFRSTDTDTFTDQVQNVQFRINDIDFSALGGDLGEANVDGFEDIVTIIATDAEGNTVPVTMTPEGAVSVTGDTATGTTETVYTDADGSLLVEIAGPVQSIQIVYENGDNAQQGVTVSDVHFSTVDTGDDLPPVANDDAATTPEDTAVIVDVLANDSDPEGGALTVTGATVDTGTVTVNPDNTLTYTPPADYNGPATISYTIEDPAGNSATGEVAVTVEPVNDAPVAVDDTDTTEEGTPVTIDDPSDNDTDPDGDPLSVTGVGTPTNGTATLNPDGTVTYTPDPDFTGDDTIPYTVDDGNGGTDTGEIIVTVTPDGDPNTAPDAVDDASTTPMNTAVVIPVQVNDTDPEGDVLSTTTATDPANGSVAVNADGTITYTPDADFTGTDTFDYTISDGNGGSDTATVTVTVAAPGTPPVAFDDATTTEVGTPVTIDPALNDFDTEDPVEDLDITSLGTPTNGTAVINPDGTVTYTPDAGFTGTDTFTYEIEDTDGLGDQATVTVTVTDDGGNRAPEAVDDTATTEEGTPVTITDPSDNDTDPDGDPLTVTGVGTPTNGTATLNPDGTVTYTPDDGFTGEDTIPYTVDDGNGGTDTGEIVVTVTPDDGENTPPVAVDDTATTEEGTPVTIDDPSDNDTDADGDPLTVTGVGTPTNGTATLNPDGTVTYTPDDGFTGEDTIPYTVDDGNGGTDTGEIIVTVTPDTGPGRIDTDIFPVSPDLQALDPFNGLDQDPDPSDDLDSVDGTGGADSISTGDDADTINAGGGDDTVNPGIDNDLVDLGGGNDSLFDLQGADTITGGQGDDTIIAGTDTFSNYEGDDPTFPTLGFDSDPNTDDGRDSVQGNLGNDSIMTGDDDDTIDGGGDNDTLDGGIDDDLIMGGQGDDSLIGGHGADTLDGGQGNDVLDGSISAPLTQTDDVDVNTENDRDSLNGALGDDTIRGGDDDDTLVGGSGNDLLDGGIDEDSLLGGGDDDTLIGGQGADTLDGGDGDDSISGGADRDVIRVTDAAAGTDDTVDGGSEGDDYDILDLSGVGTQDVDWRLVDTSPDSNGNGIDGTVEFLDGDGAVTGTMEFFEIEEIVPCFTPGTLIATPQGERLVEDLQVGDRVITRDNGIQQIKWIGRKDLTGFDLARKPHFKPILIQKGALGNNLPEHDLLVSPNHRVLVANDKTALYFEEREVLVAAKHLVGQDGVDEVESLGVSYIHVMFEQHEVILSNGAWTESFQPGDYTLKGIGAAQREEIFELFPELEQTEGLEAYGAARRSLKKHEAQLLVS
ncbi:MAG: Ig-like domain-containing protein [Pelagimonas sp.]|jgi:hypothetical protein|nr:Ig-like domain-containing protein [Pelagimonas sp.]